MKATGIVRRIDELGRVVIPKEIRRTLRIKEGDPLEIFTDRDELMLKKYSPIATLERFSKATARSLNDLSGKLAVICDTDGVLHACGDGRKDFDGKGLSEDMDKILKERRSYIANVAEGGDIIPITNYDESDVTAQVIVPIVCRLVLCRRGGMMSVLHLLWIIPLAAVFGYVSGALLTANGRDDNG